MASREGSMLFIVDSHWRPGMTRAQGMDIGKYQRELGVHTLRRAAMDKWVRYLLRMIFVKPHEIAERHWKFHVLIGIKWIEADRIFEASHDQCKTKRIKARLQQLQIIRETRKLALLLLRNLLELRGNRRSERH